MKFSILCVCASMALAAPAAFAEAKSETVTADLLYDQSDLKTAEGAAGTLTFLKEQAQNACMVQTFYGRQADRKCVAMMVTNAVEKIDSPMLTAVYKGTQLPFNVASR